MKIIRATDYEDMSRKAANYLSAQVIIKEDSVLGLATGSTVIGIYNQLSEWYTKGDIDFSQVSTVNLDEYVGLSPTDNQSYHSYMCKTFFSKVNLKRENCHLPDGMAENLQKECIKYDKMIKSIGGIDMQLLGLGVNGHIGFNEPHKAFDQNTHLVTLSESTRKANSRLFPSVDAIPKQAITMGISTIMQAKRILLCVSGQRKASILKKILYGPVIPAVPGSILQMHSNLTVIADKDALCE